MAKEVKEIKKTDNLKRVSLKDYLRKQFKEEKKGFSVVDLLIWGTVVAGILGFLALAISYLSVWKSKNSYLSDFKMILQGLDSYYQTAYYYPGGSPDTDGGWDWDINSNYAYIPQRILARGWQYECDKDNRRITIYTPAISNKKVLSGIYDEFRHNCDEAGVTSDNRAYCTLYDKPCGLEE
jgi:hypothetical protein